MTEVTDRETESSVTPLTPLLTKGTPIDAILQPITAPSHNTAPRRSHLPSPSSHPISHASIAIAPPAPPARSPTPPPSRARRGGLTQQPLLTTTLREIAVDQPSHSVTPHHTPEP